MKTRQIFKIFRIEELDKITIQVKHTPRNIVYIHEMSMYANIDEMLTAMTTGLSAGRISDTLKWVGGIALTFTAVRNNTEFTTIERSKGILRWEHVAFAHMKKYQKEFNLPSGVIINVEDVSVNETFSAIGKFLKKYMDKK